MSVTAIRLEMDTEQMQKIFGMQDAYIKKLEQDFQVTIVDRNGSVMITGEEENVSKASRVLRQLTALSDHGNEIEEQSVDYAIEMGKEAISALGTFRIFNPYPTLSDTFICGNRA